MRTAVFFSTLAEEIVQISGEWGREKNGIKKMNKPVNIADLFYYNPKDFIFPILFRPGSTQFE